MQDLMQAVKAVENAPKSARPLARGDFTLTEGAANSRTKIASYQAETPLVLTEKAMRLMFTVVEQFQTNGTGGDTETFSLSHNAIQTPNTQDFLLYEGGSRVQPDSVNYSGDSFDYTDDGTGNYLHAYYVPREATQIQMEIEAPRSQGGVKRVVYDDVTALLHERNQQKEPPRMSFDNPNATRDRDQKASRALQRVVPRKWDLNVYQEGPVAFSWDDSDEANSQSTTATNAILTVPVAQVQGRVPGVAEAVRQSIVED